VPRKRATKAWKILAKCAQRKKNRKICFQRSLCSVPKQKERGQKKFKRSPFESAPKQSQKRDQKKLKRSLFESAPKRMSEKVPKQSLKCAQKKVHIPSHPLFPALIPSFTISPPFLGTLWITENNGRNPDRGWDRVWDWGGLYR
jgi:hypothetical protein